MKKEFINPSIKITLFDGSIHATGGTGGAGGTGGGMYDASTLAKDMFDYTGQNTTIHSAWSKMSKVNNIVGFVE